MEEKLLEELYASYKGDTYATHLKGLVEKYGDMHVAEMIIDQFEDGQRNNQNQDVIEFRIGYHQFWPCVKREFDKLVCGQSPYEKENQDYYVFGKFFSLATASAIATSISPVLSIPVYVLTPTIALMLNSMMKIGRNAYCSTVK